MAITSLTASPATPAPKVATATGATGDAQAASQTPAVAEVSDLQTAIATATQAAAARQDGLAVLMANLLQVSGKLPDPLLAALDQLIGLHLSSGQEPDAASMKTAVQNSGLFTEAKLAAGAPAAEIAADVKAVLLRLNAAAEQWLARAQNAAKDPPAPEVRTEPNTSGGAAASGAAPTKPAIDNLRSLRAVLPDVRTPQPEAPHTPTTPIRSGAAGAPARPTASQSTAQAVAPAGTTPASDAPTLPTDLRNALVQLGKAAAIWMARPNVSMPAQPTTINNTGVAPPTSSTATPNGASAPAPQQPNTAVVTTDGSTKAAATPPLLPQPAAPKVMDAPRSGTAPQAAPAKPADAEQAAVSRIAIQAGDSMPAAMQAMRQMTAAMLSAPRPDVPPELKAVLFALNQTAETWSTAPQTEAAPGSAASTVEPAMPGRSAPAAAATSSNTPQSSAPQTTVSAATAAQTSAAMPPASQPNIQSPPQAVPNELKSVLALLNRVAENWLTPEPANQPASSTANPPADPRASNPSVPPPVAGAPGKAQPAAQPTLPDHADDVLMAAKLVSGSDAAVARQTLLQIASLPHAAQTARGPEARWMMDIPLLTPQGPTVAQLIIERDSGSAGTDVTKPVWRVQFAVDIEPLGPVRANLALSGERTWVTITADRPDSLAKLRSGASWLTDALAASELNADIAFQSAAPQRAAGASRLVDHAL